MMSEPLLVVDRLTKTFAGINALENFSCSVMDEEVVALVGPNGAGKTTLFNILTGLLRPDSGNAAYSGTTLVGKTPHKIAQLGIARTFQNVRLIRQLSACDNVVLASGRQLGEELLPALARWSRCEKVDRACRERAMGILETIGLKTYSNSLAGVLSYGQQKLLCLAMCVASNARLLLLDEPVAGAALSIRDKVLSLVRAMRANGHSVMMIEHDMQAVASLADRVVFMDAGKRVCEGTVDEVRCDPRVMQAYLE